MKFTSGAAWSKSRWVSVGPCLDAWLYNFKWHTAADHTSLHCTPTSPLQKHTHSYTNTEKDTHTALSGEPIWERKEASLEVLPSRGDYINRWRKEEGGLQKMEERTCLGTFTFVNFRCCLFPSFKLSQKRAYCLSTYSHFSPVAELLQDNFIWLWFWIWWSEFVHLENSKKALYV